METQKEKSKAYFVGGGIASLAGAVFLIRDGKFSGDQITIFEKSEDLGGSLDGQNSNFKKFYSTRGFRILEEKIYSCTLDLFSSIPSLQDPQKTLLHEFKKFNKKIKIHSKARLIKEGLRINSRSLNIGHENKLALLQLLALPEKLLEGKRIDEHFTPSFFETNFWIEFCTIFSFQ